MIVGTGVDLCGIARMQQAISAPHGRRFIERVFTAREVAYAQRRAHPAERFAARFAAKEAGMKALGTGWRNGVRWHDFEVVNLPSGKPTLALHGVAADLARKAGVVNIALTITHAGDQAMAMVILESA